MTMDVSIPGAFAAGVLSFVSPCVLPLVPPYLAYIAGVSIEQLQGETVRPQRGPILLAALAFVAGFTVVFVVLGATASWIGQAVTSYMQWFGYGAGLLIALMGLHFLGLIRLPLLDRTARVGVSSKPAGLAGAFVIGLAFAFGWSPCVGPVLAAILLVAGAEDSAGEGARLLLVYAFGLGLPFLLAAMFAAPFMRWLAQFRRHLGVVEKIMGVFLLATGALIFFGQMPALAYWLLEVFPVLGRIG